MKKISPVRPDRLNPISPGEVLLEEFLKPMGISQNHLAIKIGVPARRINEIVLGKRRITADTALRLARFFGNSAKFWVGLQTDHDLDVAVDEAGERIEREVISYAPAGERIEREVISYAPAGERIEREVSLDASARENNGA